MQEFIKVFDDNKILILAIIVFIIGLILLSYLLTTIIINKKQKKQIKVEKEVPSKAVELDEVIDKMQKTLEENVDKTYGYEDEQEQTAIISYDELVKVKSVSTPSLVSQEELKPEVIGTEEKKFKNSVFISPIYGRQEDLEKEKNEQFLKNLKEFRNNL